MIVTVIEICETRVGVDMAPGDEIVISEGTVVDHSLGLNGELDS